MKENKVPEKLYGCYKGNMCSIDSNCVYNNPYKNNVDMKANEAPEKIYLANTEYRTLEGWH